jgi:hypothetical protein
LMSCTEDVRFGIMIKRMRSGSCAGWRCVRLAASPGRCVLHCIGCLKRPRRRPHHHRFVPVEISNRKSFVRFHSHPTPPTLTSDLMPTVASSAHPQRPPPGDADLQELYDQVLSAFADESSPSNFSPTFSISMSNNVDRDDSLYSPHSDEGVASQISSRTHPQSRR